jgi:methionine-rich copper-binding protein CopC
MTDKRIWQGFALVALMPLLLITGEASAQAHAQLLVSSPPIGATLTKAPTSVELTFDDDLMDLLGGNQIVVLDPKKHQVQASETSVTGSKVWVKLRKLKLYGKYSVLYKVMSIDGHPVTATYRFYFVKKKTK